MIWFTVNSIKLLWFFVISTDRIEWKSWVSTMIIHQVEIILKLKRKQIKMPTTENKRWKLVILILMCIEWTCVPKFDWILFRLFRLFIYFFLVDCSKWIQIKLKLNVYFIHDNINNYQVSTFSLFLIHNSLFLFVVVFSF